MQIITCASYYGTGSSAVIDYVSEFSDVYSFQNEEFRFIQDPDGISDLEFHLVENFNRHNAGHALKRYQRLAEFYNGNMLGKKYRRFFGNKWLAYSKKYIEELTDFSYKGWWMYDLYDRGSSYYFRKRIGNKLLHLSLWKDQPERVLNTLKKEITLCSHPSEEKFLECTKRYIYSLFSSAPPGCQNKAAVDQLLPPENIQRYLRYLNQDTKVAVVDRDPRDVFILDKYCWKDGMLPADPETFCKWYRYTRSHRKYENMNTDQVMFLQFEDLVYRYNSTAKRLRDWIGLDEKNHIWKKQRFDPAVSIKNTQNWRRYRQAWKEADYIEKHLCEYLYDFDRAVREEGSCGRNKRR